MKDPDLDPLQRRIDTLDANGAEQHDGDAVAAMHFVATMSAYTRSWPAVEQAEHTVAGLDAARADALVDTCRLLRILGQHDAPVVQGPLALQRQHWIGTGRHDHGQHAPRPTRQQFVSPRARDVSHTAKPIASGLYTSTVMLGGASMWRMFLDLGSERTLHPRPWYTWQLAPGPGEVPRILEIASATDWVEFVTRFPVVRERLSYPNWAAAARVLDAVHVTARAIAATQGFHFRTAQGDLTGRMYWDTETTLWLRWVFHAAQLVEETS